MLNKAKIVAGSRCWRVDSFPVNDLTQFRAVRYGLFFSVEVVDEREDETADRANEPKPIMNLHQRHLLPSRKKADTSTACRDEYITRPESFKFQANKNPRHRRRGNFFVKFRAGRRSRQTTLRQSRRRKTLQARRGKPQCCSLSRQAANPKCPMSPRRP